MRKWLPVMGLLLLGVLASVLAFAEDKDKEGETFSEIGKPSSKKYNFEYQSGKRKGSRIYRVRNEGGAVATPVSWTDGKEVLLDVTIPKCPQQDDPCKWFETTHLTREMIEGKTKLSYGLNRDECTDEPQAIRKHPDERSRNEKKP